MQQLFPREGETIPRLRFPEFRDAAEWETQAFGDYRRQSLDCRKASMPELNLPVTRDGIQSMRTCGNFQMAAEDHNLVQSKDCHECRESSVARRHPPATRMNSRNWSERHPISIESESITDLTSPVVMDRKAQLVWQFCNSMLHRGFRSRIKLLVELEHRSANSITNITIPTGLRCRLRLPPAEQQRIAECLIFSRRPNYRGNRQARSP